MKVLGSILISFIMTGVLFVISFFMCVRVFLSPYYMTKLVNVWLKNEIGIVETVSEEFPELANYLDEEELNEELGEFISDYVKYFLGVPGQEIPTLKGVKEELDEAINKYVSDTGKNFDYDSYNEEYQKLEDSIKTDLIPESERAPEEVRVVFEVIYSDVVMMVLVVVMIVLLLLNYLISKDFFVVSLCAGIVCLVHSFVYGSLGVGLLTAETDGSFEAKEVLNVIAEIPLIIAFIGGVIGVLSIGMAILIKNKKNKNNNGLGYYCPPTYNANNRIYN